MDGLSVIGACLLLLFVLLGVLGPVLPLGDPARIAAGPRLAPPSLAFPLGTDELGRSFLPRVVEGIRYTCSTRGRTLSWRKSMMSCIGLPGRKIPFTPISRMYFLNVSASQ